MRVSIFRMILKIIVSLSHIKSSCSAKKEKKIMEIQPGDDSSQMQSAYSMSLQQALKMRQDIVLDFTNLKACLDPLAEYATQNAESNDQNQQTQVKAEIISLV